MQAQAQVKQAEAGADQAKAQVVQAQAELAQRAAQFEIARINYERNSSLYQKDLRAVAKEDVDTTKANFDAAQATLAGSQASVTAAAAAAGESAAAQVGAAQAAVHVAEAAVDNADLQLSYTRIIAAESGRITRKNVDVGTYVQPAQTLFAVVNHNVWVTANFKETQLARMKDGQPVTIQVDAYPGRKLHGHVESVQLGSGSRFSLLPAENATGNFVKVVQRIPVKIILDESPEVLARLGPGMSVEPKSRHHARRPPDGSRQSPVPMRLSRLSAVSLLAPSPRWRVPGGNPGGGARLPWPSARWRRPARIQARLEKSAAARRRRRGARGGRSFAIPCWTAWSSRRSPPIRTSPWRWTASPRCARRSARPRRIFIRTSRWSPAPSGSV